jgi:predicted PurR-regulated permease PerM
VAIALLLSLAALRVGAAFFIPLLLSLFLNYALAPVVNRLQRIGLWRPIAAAIAVALVAALLGGAFWRVYTDLGAVLAEVPPAVERLRLAVQAQGQATGTLQHVQRTAAELEKLAKAAAPDATTSGARAAPAPAPTTPALDFRSALLVGTSNVFIAAGQVGSALLLSFFLLSAGSLFRRKLIHVAGPSLGRQKTLLRILDDVDRLNQRYFAVVLFINVLVGITTGAALWAIGLMRPDVWGIAAAVLHAIPYLGPMVVGGAAGLVAYGQFGTAQAALLAALLPIAIAGAIGVGLQTWVMGHAARMNAPAVFVSLLFWGMVWGGWGLLLAVPVTVAIKTVCDHVDRLKPFGEILGE